MLFHGMAWNEFNFWQQFGVIVFLGSILGCAILQFFVSRHQRSDPAYPNKSLLPRHDLIGVRLFLDPRKYLTATGLKYLSLQRLFMFKKQ